METPDRERDKSRVGIIAGGRGGGMTGPGLGELLVNAKSRKRVDLHTGSVGYGMSFRLEHLAEEAYIAPKKMRCPECMKHLPGTEQGFGTMYLCRFCDIIIIKLREGSGEDRVRMRMGKEGIMFLDPESDVCKV